MKSLFVFQLGFVFLFLPTYQAVSILKSNSGDRELSLSGGECRRNEDCPQAHCCTVGMMRYSVPSCFPLGKMNDPCIPNSNPQNFTLSYPSEKILEVRDSYLITCPCLPYLTCDKSSASCQLQIDKSIDLNSLNESADE